MTDGVENTTWLAATGAVEPAGCFCGVNKGTAAVRTSSWKTVCSKQRLGMMAIAAASGNKMMMTQKMTRPQMQLSLQAVTFKLQSKHKSAHRYRPQRSCCTDDDEFKVAIVHTIAERLSRSRSEFFQATGSSSPVHDPT